MVNDSDLIQTELWVCAPLTAVCTCVSAAGSLLWFLCSGMCEELAGWAPRHLLNIRGNNSWADLKHGHPLHLAVSLRITPAASHSRWQVPVHQPTEFRTCQWAISCKQFMRKPLLLVLAFSCCAWEQSGWYTVISLHWYPTMFDFP